MHALINDLGYRAPSLMREAVVAARVAGRSRALFKRIIDLGCGTGLRRAASQGRSIISPASTLSPGMIKEARATELYAENLRSPT